MHHDIGEARVGIALGRLERLAEEAVDRNAVGIDRRPRDQRRRQRHIEKRRQPEKAARPESRPGAGRIPVFATRAQPVLVHHQEAREQDEQVHAEVRLADQRQAETGQDHHMPDEHPEGRDAAQAIQTLDSPNVH